MYLSDQIRYPYQVRSDNFHPYNLHVHYFSYSQAGCQGGKQCRPWSAGITSR